MDSPALKWAGAAGCGEVRTAGMASVGSDKSISIMGAVGSKVGCWVGEIVVGSGRGVDVEVGIGGAVGVGLPINMQAGVLISSNKSNPNIHKEDRIMISSFIRIHPL